MDIEFHYYITAYLAHEAGFSKESARIIAYASQYVDENDVSFKIINRQTGRRYRNFISQTMNILKPKQELMRIYPIFHFVPGEPDAVTARRVDGKQHILNTTPNSENANFLMDAAMKSDHQLRLYRIGIATHMYVDTWAHQNFVGWYDVFNQVSLDIKPNIGHADGEHHPDWVSHRWFDERLVEPEVNNRHRFLSAAKALFAWYCQAEGRDSLVDASEHWPKVEKLLSQMMGPTYTGNACKYQEDRLACYEEAMPWLSAFDERAWFDEAIETMVHGGVDTHEGLRARFTVFSDEYFWREQQPPEQTHWFRFQESIKAHERAGIERLNPLFAQMGCQLERI
jgi:hypothetical protein